MIDRPMSQKLTLPDNYPELKNAKNTELLEQVTAHSPGSTSCQSQRPRLPLEPKPNHALFSERSTKLDHRQRRFCSRCNQGNFKDTPLSPATQKSCIKAGKSDRMCQ
eukprot:1556042-Amphidinium_carterae.1